MNSTPYWIRPPEFLKPKFLTVGVKTGLLINFNVTKLKEGIKRFVL